MVTYTFEMPYPPSVNSMWRTPRTGPAAGRTLLSEDGRRYRLEVQRQALAQSWPKLGDRPHLRVEIEAHMPDRRRRDVDNVLKGALDGLQHAGVMDDDNQIDHLSITRYPFLCGRGGHLVVRIRPEQWPQQQEIAA